MTVLLEYILMTSIKVSQSFLQIQVAEKWSTQCQTGQTMGSSLADNSD